MRYQSLALSLSQEQNILSAYGEAVAAAGQDAQFRQRLAGKEGEVLPRFSAHYQRLTALPRRARRAMQRQWKRTLAGVALLMALGAGPSMANTINVDTTIHGVNILDGKCSLIEAILKANDQLLGVGGVAELPALGGCELGSTALLGANGADTIVLQPSIQTLTQPFTNFFGPTGLPVITSPITINGNDSTIRRLSTDPDIFRIFAVGRGGNLTLQRTTVSGGATIGDDHNGGGVFNSYGGLTLTNSTISGNSTAGNSAKGGGVYQFGGSVTLINSTISGNSTSGTDSAGGGVFNIRGVLTVDRSTISGNHTLGNGADGGGVAQFYRGSMDITNSTISGNGTFGNDADGGGVWHVSFNYARLTIRDSTITRNFTLDPSSSIGGGVYNYRGSLTLTRTIISGNTTSANFIASEVKSFPSITPNAFNLFGHNGLTTAQLLVGVTPGPTDITATSNGTIPRTVSQILNTTLANNGGPTLTHSISPVSIATDAVTTGCPPPTTDQRGRIRPRDGNGDGVARCDIGAYER